MNVTGGGLSFEISGTNDKLVRVLAESKKAIQNFSTSAQQGGKGVDAAFTDAKAAIDKAFADIDTIVDTNKAAIDALKKKYDELTKQINAAFNSGTNEGFGQSVALAKQRDEIEKQIRQRKKLIEEAGKTADALLAEEQALNQQREAMEKSSNTHQSLRSQLRQVREQLALMEADGKRGTEAFRKLQLEAGRLTDALGDAQTQVRILSHDNAGLQGIISGVSGVAGAMTAAQGAVSLFVGENENLQKAMLKVQSLMSITMGLQQVLNTLNKDSAFMLTTVTKAKEWLAAANIKLATALGISNVAAKALMATLTLGLSVAITGVVWLINKLTSSNEEAAKSIDKTKEAFDNFHSATASKSADLVGRYQKLRNEYAQLQTAAEKQEWIKQNASEFDNLSLAVGGVTDADNIFITNTPKVVKALELRAKAMALQELQMEAYKVYYEKIVNADNTVAGGGYYHKVGDVIEPGSQAAKELSAAMKKAGAVSGSGDAYNDGSWYSMEHGNFKLTKKAIDAINAYRIEQANATNKRIHDDATAELNKTTGYVEKELQLTQKQIDELNILRAGGGKNGGGKGGNGGNSGGNKSEVDEYAAQLQARKGLYEKYLKWVTSSDETVRNAAANEFAPLLEQGTSYLDYLERQRAAIEAKATKTATDLKNLSTLNNEIAEATKEAVISDFNTQLQADLAQCQTISQMLDVIERRWAELSGDNSDVDNAKAEILTESEADVNRQAKEETAALLEEYAHYLQEKLDFEESYARKRELLTRRIAQATSEAEKQAAMAALEGLEAKRTEYAKRSNSELYDGMLAEYQTVQEKKAAILEKYETQRAEAIRQGNNVMVTLINQAEQAELSKLAASRLMASESWNQLFTDISRLSTTTINRLLKDINSRKVNLSAQLNPAGLKTVNDQLEKARQELQKRNPFLALKQSLAELRTAMAENKLLDSNDPFVKSLEAKKKAYQEYIDAINSDDPTVAGAANQIYADLLKDGGSYVEWLKKQIAALNALKVTLQLDVEGEEKLAILNAALNKEQGVTKSVGEGFKEAFGSIGSSIDFVKGCFDGVVGGMKKIGIAMDEETEAILGDIGGILDGASQLSQGIATGNPLGIITGSIGLLSSAIDLFNSRDRKAEKSIRKHEENVTRLGRAYTALQHAVDNALGATVYQNQNAQIKNLRAQQNEIRGMIEDEKSKKHSDWSKVEDYQERYAAAGREIEDIIKEITASITQTTAGDLANELADALVEAWGEGKTAAEAFGDVANQVLQNAVKNALKLQFLEKPLQNAIKQLQKDMGFDEEGNGSFDGLTEAEQARFKAAVQAAGANFAQAMDMYKDLFKELEDESDPTTLSGAIKGASQESIDLLAGQTNAVRQNQVTSIALLREQLGRLANIDTGVNRIYGTLLNILNRLSNDSGTDYRSQGITD